MLYTPSHLSVLLYLAKATKELRVCVLGMCDVCNSV